MAVNAKTWDGTKDSEGTCVISKLLPILAHLEVLEESPSDMLFDDEWQKGGLYNDDLS